MLHCVDERRIVSNAINLTHALNMMSVDRLCASEAYINLCNNFLLTEGVSFVNGDLPESGRCRIVNKSHRTACSINCLRWHDLDVRPRRGLHYLHDSSKPFSSHLLDAILNKKSEVVRVC